MNQEKITVKQASEILGISTDYIRYLMRSGKLPIGHAVKGKGKGYRYLIYRPMLEAYIGRNIS